MKLQDRENWRIQLWKVVILSLIFITQLDYLGQGLPVYHISRIIEETGEKINDESHILYVNGSHKGNDVLGQLMHDFSCKDADDMHYDALKRGRDECGKRMKKSISS